MARSTAIRVAISSSSLAGPPRKLTSVQPYKSGGFGVLVPYHKERSGFLGKMPVDYSRPGDFTVAFSEIRAYGASDRVKLSYHPDGFVQFSGEVQGKIVSGRESDGTIKGLGLMTHPLSDPIRSGPSFGLLAFGLDKFEPLKSGEAAIVFSDEDFYFRRTDPESANAWMLEAFVFPETYWAGVRKVGNDLTMNMILPSADSPGAVFALKILRLGELPYFLGLIVSRTTVDFDVASGWHLSGPGEYDRRTGKGHTLFAFYPNVFGPLTSGTSLDRTGQAT